MLQLEILPFDVHTWKKGFKHINEKAASIEGDFFFSFYIHLLVCSIISHKQSQKERSRILHITVISYKIQKI
jgi:hypothetical protein